MDPGKPFLHLITTPQAIEYESTCIAGRWPALKSQEEPYHTPTTCVNRGKRGKPSVTPHAQDKPLKCPLRHQR